MKSVKVLITVLLSMLFLLIAMYPCMDVYVQTDSSNNTTLVREVQHADHSTMDDCSPLCACVCCAASITVALALHVSNVQTYNAVVVTPLPFDNLVQGEEKPIWQPPKIA